MPNTSSFEGDRRCCDVCHPDRFPVDDIRLDKAPGLTRGRKRVFPPTLADSIRTGLQSLREDVLFPVYHPTGSNIISPAVLLGDDVIDRVISCGKRLSTADDLSRNIRWFLAFDHDGELSQYGQLLIAKLTDIYDEFDHTQTVEESSSDVESSVASTSGAQAIDPEQVPNTPMSQPAILPEVLPRGRGARSRGRGRPRGTSSRGANTLSMSLQPAALVLPEVPPRGHGARGRTRRGRRGRRNSARG